MLNIALAQDIPVLGICRGMERINVYFGGGLQDVASVEGGLDHDETRHEITILDSSISQALGGKTFEVNSYHRTVIGASQLATGLHRFAVAADHTIEAFYHPEYAVAATIWHPERETSPHVLNEYLVSAFLSRKLFWQPRKGVAHEK
jgi:putative glutamine amidotransferase